MKLKTLLLCGGALAVSSAQAALNVTERQLVLTNPAQTGMPTDGQTVVYLYNPGTQGFLMGGNNYNTRATVKTGAGYRWKIAVEDADANLVSLNDSVEYDNNNKACTWGWRKMFTDNAEAVYVDNNNGANANAWQLESVGDGKYRITNTAILGEGGATLYLGALTGSTVVNLYADGTENANLDWYAVTPDEYKELVKDRATVLSVYDASVALYAALQSADEAGVPGLAQYEAVYANENSTVEELQTATAAVKEAQIAYLASKATADAPVDLSASIENADFANNNATGWSGTALAFQSYGDAEHYNKTYNTYQEIKNIPNGVYALKSQAYYRAGYSDASYDNFVKNAEKNAKLYAINKVAEEGKSDTLASSIMNVFDGITADNSLGGNESKVEKDGSTYYVPNNMETAKTYFDAGYYKDNQVLFAVSENNAIIGVKKESTVSGDWSIFNNFELKYYGEGADAFKLWNEDIVKNAATYTEEQAAEITPEVLAAYEAAKEAHSAGTTYEEVMANRAAIAEAQADIEANVAAWAAYVEEYQSAQVIVSGGGYEGDEVDALNDYLMLEAEEPLQTRSWSTEEVVEQTAQLKALKAAAMTNIKKGTDMTDLLSNPDFSQGGKGWTKKAVSGGNVAFNASAKCAEGWNNADFDIYQTVENAPVGAYKISVQGFYRRGRGDNAWKLYFNETTGEKLPTVPESPAYVYCNDMKTPLANVYDYAVSVAENYYTGDFYTDAFDRTFPNNMADAGLAFDHGAYLINTTGLVANEGDALRIGMKGNTTQEGDSWAIFTRFKLTYMADDEEILSDAIASTVAGVDLDKAMGTDVKAKAQELVDAANAAVAAGEGKNMRLALAALLQYNDAIESSVSLFTTLQATAEDFQNFVIEAPEEYDELKAEAMDYIENLNFSAMTDEEANAAIAKIAGFRYQLSLPVGWQNATDAEPVDMTSIMQTPNFDKDGVNSVEGWQNTTGYNFGNNDTQKAALAVEFYDKNFDLYQDIELPNGTYQVSAMAFNRAGSVDADFAAVTEGTASKALLYAKSGETEVTKPIEHLTSVDGAFAASSEKLGLGAESTFTGADGNTYNVPNDMVSSVAYFDQGRYLNGVTIKVTDGKLRVGVRQENKVSGSWVIMDSFKLMYFGEESTKQNGTFTDVDAVEVDANVAKIEVYSVDGVKQNVIQKGVNILVITDKNGNVTTKTVIK